MRLKIEIFSRFEEIVLVADNEKNTLDYNGNYLTSNVDDFIFKAKQIIDSMPDKVESAGIFDGTKYRIAYKDGENKVIKIGDEPFSANLDNLIKIIEEVADEGKHIS